MEFKDYLAVLTLGCIWFGSALFTYHIGKHVERKELTHYLVSETDKFCDKCYAIGYSKGIRTCDDVISDVNSGGRR